MSQNIPKLNLFIQVRWKQMVAGKTIWHTQKIGFSQGFLLWLQASYGFRNMPHSENRWARDTFKRKQIKELCCWRFGFFHLGELGHSCLDALTCLGLCLQHFNRCLQVLDAPWRMQDSGIAQVVRKQDCELVGEFRSYITALVGFYSGWSKQLRFWLFDTLTLIGFISLVETLEGSL